MLGISTSCCPAGASLATFLETVRHLGLTAVEHVEPGPPNAGRALYARVDMRVQALRGAHPPPLLDRGNLSDWLRAHVRPLAAAATRVGCRRVIVPAIPFGDGAVRRDAGDLAGPAPDPKAREAALELLCRTLHGLLAEAPQLELALVAWPDAAGLPDARELPLLFETLPDRRLGYWHAPDVCQATGAADLWLEHGRARLVGSYMSDRADGTLGGLPGTGDVDWTALAGYLRRDEPKLVRVQPGPTRGALASAISFLEGLGWRC